MSVKNGSVELAANVLPHDALRVLRARSAVNYDR